MKLSLNDRHAFTLVELSIVLVILGLLVGGVLAGKSLIRASEIRSISTDLTKYSTAAYAFRDKYFGLPGDITNATSIWGTDPDGCPTNTNRVFKTQTCDGDGDGKIGSNSPEEFHFWQQLADAGLIGGSFTGVTGPLTTGDNDAGVNAPVLRTSGADGVSVYYVAPVAGGTGGYAFPGSYGNIFTAGHCGSYDCNSAFLLPEEAWNIDTKIDDGFPASGKLRTRVSCVTAGCMPNCNTATDDSTASAAAATYNFSYTTAACALNYRALP